MRAAIVDVVVGDGDPFDVARALGCAGVECVLPARLGGDELSTLLEAARRHGLELPALILGEHNARGGIADADPEVADRARDDVAAALDWARALGTDTILVPFFLAAELADDGALERCAAAFAQLCPLAQRAGVTLSFEGSLPAAELHRIARRVASPAFGCHFDPANLVVAGLDPAAEARRLGPLVHRVHLKDTRERRGDCRLGEGRVDFEACRAALDAIGYDGWAAIEGLPGDREDVARDLSFARTLFRLG